MLISIITINYNNLKGLIKTTQSVHGQSFTDYEHIIIDGKSTDGSKEYIEQNADNFSYWISEPDKGIYNAMNKGIAQAKGDFLLFLNSGDSLFEVNVLEQVAKQFHHDCNIYYGDVMRIYPSKKIYKKYPQELTFNFFLESALAHQAVFIHFNLFKKYFYYNEEYKVLSDWEFLLYAICKANENYQYLDMIISNYDMSGISSSPQGKELMKKEREQTFLKYFPLFIKDYDTFSNKISQQVISSIELIKQSNTLFAVFRIFTYILVYTLKIKKYIWKQS